MSTNQLNLTALSQNFDVFGVVCEHLDPKDLLFLSISCKTIHAEVQDQLKRNPALKNAFKIMDAMELVRICRKANLFKTIAIDVFMQRSQSALYSEPIQIGSDQYQVPIGFNSYSLRTLLNKIRNLTVEKLQEKEQLEAELLEEVNKQLKRSKKYRQEIDKWETRADLLELCYTLTHKYLELPTAFPQNRPMALLKSNLYNVLRPGKIDFQRVFETGYQLVWIAEKIQKMDPALIEIDYENIMGHSELEVNEFADPVFRKNEKTKKFHAGACDFLAHVSPKPSEEEAEIIQKIGTKCRRLK